MTITTKNPQIIKAEVGDNFFEIVDRLFDNSPKTVCAELIQNSRRAGATRIKFETDYVEGYDGLAIRVTDNGSGITDMADLLRIRASGWDDGIKRREDPAGMGFFCLCRMNNLVVRSKHSEADMGDNAEALHGRIDVTVEYVQDYVEGVEIKFLWPHLSLADLDCALRDVGLYAPIKVDMNDVTLPRESFRPGGVIVEFEDDDVCVYITSSVYDEPIIINFHGLVIDSPNSDPISNFSVHIDVKETGKLQMVLPARNAIVQNQFYKDLTSKIRARIYGIIAADKCHNLSFNHWNEAKSLGVSLPVAERKLRKTHVVGKVDLAIDKKCYVMERANKKGHFESVAAAMEMDGSCALYECDVAMQGYDWYDELPKITNVTYTQGEEEIAHYPIDATVVGHNLAVHCELDWGKDNNTVMLPAPILVANLRYGEDSYCTAISRGAGFIVDPTFKLDESKICAIIDASWRSSYLSESSRKDWDNLRLLDVRKCLVGLDDAFEFVIMTSLRNAMSNLPYAKTYAGQSVTITCVVDENGFCKLERI